MSQCVYLSCNSYACLHLIKITDDLHTFDTHDCIFHKWLHTPKHINDVADAAGVALIGFFTPLAQQSCAGSVNHVLKGHFLYSVVESEMMHHFHILGEAK